MITAIVDLAGTDPVVYVHKSNSGCHAEILVHLFNTPRDDCLLVALLYQLNISVWTNRNNTLEIVTI
jgi:hypothetical protein